MRNQSELSRLAELHIYGCEGVKALDLSGLRSLRKLLVGPAKGIEILSLERVPSLQHLSLVLMTRLRHILGLEFLHTVTHLDIRGSESIPKEVLSGFTRLRWVEVGMRSKLDGTYFRHCKPSVNPGPV